jgi:hypothetical protein
MDVVVTWAKTEPAWDLTDLFGRPIGRLTEDAGPWFIIEPNERTGPVMANVMEGPHPSLDTALREIEKHSPLVCRLARESQP